MKKGGGVFHPEGGVCTLYPGGEARHTPLSTLSRRGGGAGILDALKYEDLQLTATTKARRPEVPQPDSITALFSSACGKTPINVSIGMFEMKLD